MSRHHVTTRLYLRVRHGRPLGVSGRWRLRSELHHFRLVLLCERVVLLHLFAKRVELLGEVR